MKIETIIEDGEFVSAKITDANTPGSVGTITATSSHMATGALYNPRPGQPLVRLNLDQSPVYDADDLRELAKAFVDIADQLDFQEDEFSDANNELPFVA